MDWENNMLFIQDQRVYMYGNNLVYPADLTLQEHHVDEAGIGPRQMPVVYIFRSSVGQSKTSEQAQTFAKTNGIKTTFLVYKNHKYTTVQADQIAFFYVQNNAVYMVCLDKREFVLNQSLDSISQSVSPVQFYRVNRRYLVNFKAIKEVEHYYNRKLFVKLLIDTPEKLLVNKDKTLTFLSWMGDR